MHHLYGKRQTKATIILAIGQSVVITFNFSTLAHEYLPVSLTFLSSVESALTMS